MHDLDPTQAESEWLFHEHSESGGYPGEREPFGETFGEGPLDANGLYEFGLDKTPQPEASFNEASEEEAGLPESEEMELAADLLEVTGEEELDQFLGRLLRRVEQTGRRGLRSPVGGLLRGALGRLARGLPLAGMVAGTFLGGPAGGALGGRLASAVGQMFGAELEGLSPEDQEFESARRFVRFASSAGRRAGRMSPRFDPRVAARAALFAAARRHAPGLFHWWARRRLYPQDAGCTCPPPGVIAPYAGMPPEDPGLPLAGAPIAGMPAAGGGMPAAAATAGGVAAEGEYLEQEMFPVGSQHRGMWVRRGRRIILLGV
jgi:hypothetical protein